MTIEAESRGRAENPAEGQLVGMQLATAFLTGVLLIVPLQAAMGTTSYGAFVLWILIAVAAVVLVGLLLRLLRVPQALALTVTTAGVFMVLVLIGLWTLAEFGSPGGDVVVALQVGLPSAALSALTATVLLRTIGLARDAGVRLAIAVCCIGVVTTALVGTGVDNALEASRDRAALLADLEDSGMAAYPPELDGLELGSVSTTGPSGAVTGYDLRFDEPDEDGEDGEDGVLTVRASQEPPTNHEICESGTAEVCKDGGGYFVLRPDDPVQLFVTKGDVYLSVDVLGSDLDADLIGRALVDADAAEWHDILPDE